jgi:hypothetical protein
MDGFGGRCRGRSRSGGKGGSNETTNEKTRIVRKSAASIFGENHVIGENISLIELVLQLFVATLRVAANSTTRGGRESVTEPGARNLEHLAGANCKAAVATVERTDSINTTIVVVSVHEGSLHSSIVQS